MGREDPEVDELMRVIGRIYSLYGALRTHILRGQAGLRLAHLDGLVLGAICHLSEPVTVAQMGRMTSYSRQSVQRSANSLAASGLIEFVPNPQHKRAPLMVATQEGRRVEALVEANAHKLCAALKHDYPLATAKRMTGELNSLLEAILAHTGEKDALPRYEPIRPGNWQKARKRA